MTSAEPPPVPVRPRRKPAPRPTSNGTQPPEKSHSEEISDRAVELLSSPDHPLRRMTRAIEDMTEAATLLHLPPIRLDWQQDPDPTAMLAQDPSVLERRAYIETLVADYEGARTGPVTWPLPEIRPPENPDAFLVGNLIRPGTTVMLAGPPGAAKSWASRQLPLTAASGHSWFLERYAIERPLRCLVVDEDNGPDEEWRREERLLEAIDVPRSALGNYRRVTLEGVKLEEEPWQRWLRGQVRTHELDLLVLDPISEFHGGKELREDPAFRSVLAFLKRLKVDFPALATIVVHHTRKLEARDRTASRGLEDVRGQWGQTPDVVVVMSPIGERRIKWEVHKRMPFSSLILEQTESGALHMVADETVVRTKAMQNDATVIDAIREGLDTFPDLVQALGMPKSTLSGVITRLVRAGVVKRDGKQLSAPEDD